MFTSVNIHFFYSTDGSLNTSNTVKERLQFGSLGVSYEEVIFHNGIHIHNECVLLGDSNQYETHDLNNRRTLRVNLSR